MRLLTGGIVALLTEPGVARLPLPGFGVDVGAGCVSGLAEGSTGGGSSTAGDGDTGDDGCTMPDTATGCTAGAARGTGSTSGCDWVVPPAVGDGVGTVGAGLGTGAGADSSPGEGPSTVFAPKLGATGPGVDVVGPRIGATGPGVGAAVKVGCGMTDRLGDGTSAGAGDGLGDGLSDGAGEGVGTGMAAAAAPTGGRWRGPR